MNRLINIINLVNINLSGGVKRLCKKITPLIAFARKNRIFNPISFKISDISNDSSISNVSDISNYSVILDDLEITDNLVIYQSASEVFQDVPFNIKSTTQQDNNPIPNLYGGGTLKSLAACIENKRENGYLYILNQSSFWFPNYAATRYGSGRAVLRHAFVDICEGVCV